MPLSPKQQRRIEAKARRRARRELRQASLAMLPRLDALAVDVQRAAEAVASYLLPALREVRIDVELMRLLREKMR